MLIALSKGSSLRKLAPQERNPETKHVSARPNLYQSKWNNQGTSHNVWSNWTPGGAGWQYTQWAVADLSALDLSKIVTFVNDYKARNSDFKMNNIKFRLKKYSISLNKARTQRWKQALKSALSEQTSHENTECIDAWIHNQIFKRLYIIHGWTIGFALAVLLNNELISALPHIRLHKNISGWKFHVFSLLHVS